MIEISGNLLTPVPFNAHNELFELLIQSKNVKIERIISSGQTSPEDFWYDQENDEFVVILSGEARISIEYESTERHLYPGDFIHIPAHVRHRVTYTDPKGETVWLAVHFL